MDHRLPKDYDYHRCVCVVSGGVSIGVAGWWCWECCDRVCCVQDASSVDPDKVAAKSGSCRQPTIATIATTATVATIATRNHCSHP